MLCARNSMRTDIRSISHHHLTMDLAGASNPTDTVVFAIAHAPAAALLWHELNQRSMWRVNAELVQHNKSLSVSPICSRYHSSCQAPDDSFICHVITGRLQVHEDWWTSLVNEMSNCHACSQLKMPLSAGMPLTVWPSTFVSAAPT